MAGCFRSTKVLVSPWALSEFNSREVDLSTFSGSSSLDPYTSCLLVEHGSSDPIVPAFRVESSVVYLTSATFSFIFSAWAQYAFTVVVLLFCVVVVSWGVVVDVVARYFTFTCDGVCFSTRWLAGGSLFRCFYTVVAVWCVIEGLSKVLPTTGLLGKICSP